MLALLIGSLVLASGVAVARAPQAVVPTLNEVTAGDLTFHLPTRWARVQPSAEDRSAAAVWVDAQRTTRRLGLIRVSGPQPVDAHAVIQRYVPMFMGAAATEGVRTIGAAVSPHPHLDVLEWAGASRTAPASDPRLHLAADLTADHQTHYLFYLTDEVNPGENGRVVLLRNLALLRAVHQSARLAAPPTTP